MNITPKVNAATAERLDVVKSYHTPKIAVIIPHFDYSEFLDEALLSVQQQSYHDFSCIVIDDGSAPQHAERAREAVQNMSDARFSLVRHPKNSGQIHAISAGLEKTDAPFTAILDPDDRYAPTFLERMLKLHLHPKIFCPSVACDQHLMPIGKGIITGTQYANGLQRLGTEAEALEDGMFAKYGFHNFFPPTERKWVWATTTSFLFRTDALRILKPNKPLPYKGQGDSWYANGAHMLGGTILLREPLVYRGLHERNDFITNTIFSMWQNTHREGSEHLSEAVKIDVVQAFVQNNGLKYFPLESFREVIAAHFEGQHLLKLLESAPEVRAVMS